MTRIQSTTDSTIKRDNLELLVKSRQISQKKNSHTAQISLWFRQHDQNSQTRTKRPTHLAPTSLWKDIPSYKALRFTATLDITSPSAVNKQRRNIGGSLYVSYLLTAVSATDSSQYAAHHPTHGDDKTHCINKFYWFWCIAEPTAYVNCTGLQKNSVGFTHLLTMVSADILSNVRNTAIFVTGYIQTHHTLQIICKYL